MERDVFKQDAVIGAPPQLPRDDPLASELLCVSCGYDLRGLDVDGSCPECGRPIASSINPPGALAADRRWMTRATGSIRILARGGAIGLGCAPVLGLVALLFEKTHLFGHAAGPSALLAILLLWSNVLWAMTARHEIIDGNATELEPRRIARLAFVLSCAGIAGAVFARYTGLGGGWVGVTLMVASPVGLTGLLGAWAWSARLRRIALMARDGFSVRRTRMYWRVYWISWISSVGLSGAGIISSAGIVGPAGVLIAGLVAMPAALVAALWLMLCPLSMSLNGSEDVPETIQTSPNPCANRDP